MVGAANVTSSMQEHGSDADEICQNENVRAYQNNWKWYWKTLPWMGGVTLLIIIIIINNIITLCIFSCVIGKLGMLVVIKVNLEIHCGFGSITKHNGL